jgi:hypothetical protein
MALNKQMEMFEDGGLMDEGGSIDPMSGNDVPVGSTQEEVRDDIPAQLSEGEFVLPADVVRYHGLEKIMQLRDEAKAGLQKMDAMGQMGNSEEATLSDDVPFSIEDLDMEDDEVQEFQVGGYVSPIFNQGQLQQSAFSNYVPQYTPYQAPDYTQQASVYQAPQQAVTPMAPIGTPQFSSFVTPTYVAYVNEAGNTIQIPVDENGNPLIPVPAGFTKQSEQPATPDVPEQPAIQAPVQNVVQDTSSDDTPEPKILTPEEQRIAMVTDSDAFKNVSNILDTRTGIEKFGDTVGSLMSKGPLASILGVENTTNMEYDKVKREVAVGVANATDDPNKQKEILEGIASSLTGPLATSKSKKESAATPVVDGYLRNTDGSLKLNDEGNPIENPEATKIRSAGIETATVTQEKGTTVSDAVKTQAQDIANRMKELGLSTNQQKDFLKAITSQESTKINFPTKSNPIVGTDVQFNPITDAAEAAVHTTAAQSLLDKLNGVETVVSSAKVDKPIMPIRTTSKRDPRVGIEEISGRNVVRITEDGRDKGDVVNPGTGPSFKSLKDWANALKVGSETGWYGGPIKSSTYDRLSSTGKRNYNNWTEATGAPKNNAQIEESNSGDSGNNQNQSSGESRNSSTNFGRDDRGDSSYDPGGTSDPGQKQDGGFSSQALGDRTSGRTGFNKGGKATKKKMKKGGLASKK